VRREGAGAVVNPFVAETADAKPGGWHGLFGKLFLFGVPVCVVSAIVTALMRMPDAAERRWVEAMARQAEAGAVHSATLARIGGIKSDDAKADALEAGPLPLWSEAVAAAEELEQDAAGERPVFDVIAHARARETSTRLLILAFRDGDEDKLRRAEATWASADRMLAKIKAAD